jgi:Leucine-rich repeat (LRR) protein
MNNLLLSLATTPERALRLLAFALDRLGPDCSDWMKVDVDGDGDGVITFRELHLPGANQEITPERRFASISVWLEASAAQPHVVEGVCQQGGSIASSAEAAHLLVADFLHLAPIEERWPRKLVIPQAEFEAMVIGDSLRPLRVSTGAPGSLPKNLRGIWNQLRSGSVIQIRDGLDAFSALAAIDGATAELLLEEVGVDAATGALILGNRFQRAKEDANPHLLYALLGLLSRSPKDSRGALLRQAVRELKADCPSLPELRGFTALCRLDLVLNYAYGYVDPDGAVEAAISERFDALPALEILSIGGDYNLQITSLNGLIAPRLRELDGAGIGLKDIQALAGNTALESVIIRNNDQLVDISALQASAASLKRLEISNTAVKDLSVLAHAGELEELDFGCCVNLTSLKGLETLTITQQQNFSISELKNLTDLQHLPKLISGHLSLCDLAGLTSLEGIKCAEDQIKSLHIHNMPKLKDIEALRQLQRLESLVINNCHQFSTLEVLAELPALQDVAIRDCKKLSRLPAVWPATLTSLAIESCRITQLGALPAALTGSLNLVSCPSLTSLEGIEACTGLQEITIRPSITDLQALTALPEAVIHIDFCDGDHTLPDALINGLAALPQCRLRIFDSSFWSSTRITNPEVLSRITHLRALDLSQCDLDDLLPVMGLGELELLKILPRSELSKKMGGCTFDTPSEVAKLQLQLLGMG